MPQRSRVLDGCSTSPLGERMASLAMRVRPALQTEKGEAIPLRARHLPGHGAEGFVHLLLVTKALLQHLDLNVLSLVQAREPRACNGQASVTAPAAPHCGWCGALSQERLRRPDPQLGTLGQGQGPLASPL